MRRQSGAVIPIYTCSIVFLSNYGCVVECLSNNTRTSITLSAIYTSAMMRTFRSFKRVGVLAIYTCVGVRTFWSFAQIHVLLLRQETASMIQQKNNLNPYVCNAKSVFII